MTSTISADLRFASTAVATLCLKPVTTTSWSGVGSSAPDDTGSKARQQKSPAAQLNDSDPEILWHEPMIRPLSGTKTGAAFAPGVEDVYTGLDRSAIELTQR